MTKPERDRPVRARALTQMKRILALGTATGVTLGLTHCPIVCDPLPPPIQCAAGEPPSAFDRFLYVTATWMTDDAGVAGLGVEVTVGYDRTGQLDLSGNPVATGGIVSNVVNTGTDLTFDLMPDPGVTSIHLSLPLTCGKIPETFSGTLDLTGGPSDGGTVPFVVDTPGSGDGGTVDGGGDAGVTDGGGGNG